MYINSLTHYLPKNKVLNSYFKDKNGLSNEWIEKRTGITERRRAGSDENTNTMAVEAVSNAIDNLSYPITDIDLIVGATYSPYEMVFGVAHVVQNKFDINGAKALTVTSACSSFVNAVEIVEGYFAMNKSNKALVIISEHNTAYSHDEDEQAGHLWGDGAAAVFISKERISDTDIEIIDVLSEGLGNIGEASKAVCLKPINGGITMPFGKDVFKYANTYMVSVLKRILAQNNLLIDNLDYVIPHQANIRIIEYVAKQLGLEKERTIVNIDKLGNTGSASTAIALSQNINKFKKGDLIGITVFGGGYSSGALLLKV